MIITARIIKYTHKSFTYHALTGCYALLLYVKEVDKTRTSVHYKEVQSHAIYNSITFVKHNAQYLLGQSVSECFLFFFCFFEAIVFVVELDCIIFMPCYLAHPL